MLPVSHYLNLQEYPNKLRRQQAMNVSYQFQMKEPEKKKSRRSKNSSRKDKSAKSQERSSSLGIIEKKPKAKASPGQQDPTVQQFSSQDLPENQQCLPQVEETKGNVTLDEENNKLEQSEIKEEDVENEEDQQEDQQVPDAILQEDKQKDL